MKQKRVDIYDTTLRDGAQGMGVSFSTDGKLSILRKLDELGVDYVEGGYPGSSRRDMELFAQARKLKLSHSTLVAFGSTRRAGMRVKADDNVRRLVETGTPVVTVFGKAWRLHVTDVLRTSDRENLAMIADTVSYLKEHGRRVFFDAEHFYDGYKDDPSFAMQAVMSAIGAGCDLVVLCDTNGGSLPEEVCNITREVVRAVRMPVGIHAHNDGGMAAANSVEAVLAGATQVQGTVNGYGERCGNANLCTLIPTLVLKMGRKCMKANAMRGMKGLSELVDEMANLRRDERQPYVGKNAFAHKGGMHVNAVGKNPRTFEHVPPESVGNDRSVLLSEASGQSSVLLKAIEVGVDGLSKSSPELRDVLRALKEMESRGYAFEAAEASFRMLVQKVLKKHKPFFKLEGFRVIVEKRGKDEPCISEATIKVRVNKEVEQTVGEGRGPVDALNKALRMALTKFYPQISDVSLKDFRVRIMDPEEATGATTRVLMESSDGHATWGTVGVSHNIIEASWEALVDSLEYKLFRDEEDRRRAGRKTARGAKTGRARGRGRARR